MAITFERETTEAAPKRRLPIQIANEAKTVRATIELLGTHDVDQITSRMIADASGTATNYISRYFGGRDGLLAAVADELGMRIATQIDGFEHQPGLDAPGAFLVHAVAIPEAFLWFKLFRHLAGRNLPSSAHPGGKPPLIEACESAMSRIFRIEGDDVPFWSNLVVTYILGNLAFGALLGTTAEENDRTLRKLAAVVETLRGRQIPVTP
jgi:AcrR family transcriptional regulator